MIPHLIHVVIYAFSFFISLWALSGLDFEKLLRKGQTVKAQVLVMLMAMAMGWLVGSFILVMTNMQ